MLPPDPQTPPPDTRRGGLFVFRPTRRRVALALVLLALFGGGYWRYRVTRPDYRLARGQAALRAGDWDAVVAFANRLADTGHADHAHLLRGEALLVRQHPDLALRELSKVPIEGPHRVATAALTGRCLLALGELRGAHTALALVIAERPDHVDAHRGLAAIAYDLGHLGAALEHLERVGELDPHDARPHRLIGLIYKDMAQHARAEAAYREALRRGVPDSDSGRVRCELAEVLVQQTKFSEGLEALGAGGPGADGDPDRVAARAECLRGLGRRDEALEVVDRALGAHPTAALFRLRGQIDLDQGRPVDAARQLERAAEKAPADHQVHYLLAQAYAATGRKDDSARAFARVDEIRKDLDTITALSRRAMDEPWDAPVRLELADVSDRLGKPQLATVWRKAAAACAPR